MKFLLTLIALLLTAASFSQNIYYDDTLHVVPEKNATIKAAGTMADSLYEVKGNYIKSPSAIACIIHYADATLKIKEGLFQGYDKKGNLTTTGFYHNNHHNGLWVSYWADGEVSDSSMYDDDHATIVEGFYYYPNTKHLMAATLDDIDHNKFYYADYIGNETMILSDSMDVDYSQMSFTADNQPQYAGGPTAWMRYIARAIQANPDEFTARDYGTALIRFVIDTSGKVSQVQAISMLSTMLARIGVEAIMKGPAWIPATKDGHKVETIRIQPITLTNPDN